MTQLGIRLFGAKLISEWKARLTVHYRSDKPFTAEERGLREGHLLSAETGGCVLLEWAIEETLRGILGTRKGRRRERAVSAAVLRHYRFDRAQLVVEAPGKATTTFRGQRRRHDVDGIIGIDCTVREPSGEFFKKVRCRFVSHPFWQLGVSVMPQIGNGEDDDP